MYKYSLLSVIFGIFISSATAQVSGFMGKNSAISVVAYFQPLRTSYNSVYGTSTRTNLIPHIQASYERAFSRQQSFIIQTRYLNNQNNPSYETYTRDPRTANNEAFMRTDHYSIVQVGLEYATYKKRNWTLAPIGKSMRWGVHFNAMFYNFEQTRDVLTISEKGMYLFPSLSGQFNDRIPINKNLSFNYGIGIDLPIGLLNFKDGDFGLVMLQSFVFSRLFNVGLSYNL